MRAAVSAAAGALRCCNAKLAMAPKCGRLRASRQWSFRHQCRSIRPSMAACCIRVSAQGWHRTERLQAGAAASWTAVQTSAPPCWDTPVCCCSSSSCPISTVLTRTHCLLSCARTEGQLQLATAAHPGQSDCASPANACSQRCARCACASLRSPLQHLPAASCQRGWTPLQPMKAVL